MKNLLIAFAIICCCFAANAQTTPSAAERFAAIPGLYKGTLPCADCSGIESMLILQGNTPFFSGNYFVSDKYRGTKNGDQWNRKKGTWHIINEGTPADRHRLVVALDWQTPEKATYYLVTKDGNLAPLDKDQHEITASADIILKKH